MEVSENTNRDNGMSGTALGLGIGGLTAGGLALLQSHVNKKNNAAGDIAAAMAPALGAMAASCIQPATGRCSEDHTVDRYTLDLKFQIAEKDSALALADAKENTREEIIATYRQVRGEINTLEDKMDKRISKLEEAQCEQRVYNEANNGAIRCLRSQTETLMGMTKIIIPNTSICPGWGEVKVTPVTPT